MQKYQFIKVDSILAKYHRDFKGLGLDEGDAIEWIGEALGFMKIVGAAEEAVAFLEVKNHQAPIPNGLHYVIQIAKYNGYDSIPENCGCTPEEVITNLSCESNSGSPCSDCNDGWTSNLVPIDCDGEIIGDYEVAYYRPFFDLRYEYMDWVYSDYYKNRFTPVRLADHTFFNSVVCRIPETENNSLYHTTRDEYTVVQDYLRFNFKEGFVALSYLRQIIDPETGYPMIPDDEAARNAITYYITWKIKQREWYVNNREGSRAQSVDAEQHWLKYKRQFSAKTKMPSTVDDMQDLMEQSTYLIPRRRDYYSFFGKLTEAEVRPHFSNTGRFRAYIGV